MSHPFGLASGKLNSAGRGGIRSDPPGQPKSNRLLFNPGRIDRSCRATPINLIALPWLGGAKVARNPGDPSGLDHPIDKMSMTRAFQVPMLAVQDDRNRHYVSENRGGVSRRIAHGKSL